MTTEFLTNADRRRLLFSAATLTTGLHGHAASATAPRQDGNGPDAALLAACTGFSRIERQRLALLDGPRRIADDDARDLALAPLLDQQLPFLDALCEQRATTLAGHQARAIAFWLWDGGELAYRARQSGTLEDRILSALVLDLAGAPSLTLHSNTLAPVRARWPVAACLLLRRTQGTPATWSCVTGTGGVMRLRSVPCRWCTRSRTAAAHCCCPADAWSCWPRTWTRCWSSSPDALPCARPGL